VRARLLAVVVFALTLAACTSSIAPSPTSSSTSSRPAPTTVPAPSTVITSVGVVTGMAEPCTGPAAYLPTHVKVQLHSGLMLVASQTIRSGARYRFTAVPGSYSLTGWWGAVRVTVRAAHTVTTNFLDTCF